MAGVVAWSKMGSMLHRPFCQLARLAFVLSLLGSPMPPSSMRLWADEAPAAEAEQSDAPEPAPSIFPDPGLEKAVRAEVFEKRSNQEPITAEDVAHISRVMGRNANICDLSGLEHCIELRSLDLTGNHVTDLQPLSNLKRLQSVTLSSNELTDLTPLITVTTIQHLEVADNQLTDLSPLKTLVNLRSLYASGNQLTSLDPVVELTKLWTLDVSDNSITDPTVLSGCESLQTLLLAGNAIDSLDWIAAMPPLDLIDLRRNRITDVRPLLDWVRGGGPDGRSFAAFVRSYLGGNPVASDPVAVEAIQSEGIQSDVVEAALKSD